MTDTTKTDLDKTLLTKKQVRDPDSPIELAKTVLLCLSIAFVLRLLVFQPFNIPSESMRPKLLVGDYVVVSKWDYGLSFASIPFNPRLWEGRIFGGAPKRGEVVVFKHPSDDKTDYIKRVIGLPGDRVQVVGGQVVINGTPVPRELVGPEVITDVDGNIISVNTYRETLPNGVSFITYDYGPDQPLDNTDVYVVPEGHLFMMGDNRDNSTDSRVPTEISGVGYVPIENVVGKARTVLLSWDNGVQLINPISWFSTLRWNRLVVSVQ